MAGESDGEVLREAATVIADAQNERVDAAIDASIAEAAIEHAEQRVENAEKMAEQIADAAVMSDLGRRIATVEDQHRTLHERIDACHESLNQLTAVLTPLLQRIVAELSNLTEETEEIAEAEEEHSQSTQEVLTELEREKAAESSQKSDADEKPVKRKRKTFL